MERGERGLRSLWWKRRIAASRVFRFRFPLNPSHFGKTAAAVASPALPCLALARSPYPATHSPRSPPLQGFTLFPMVGHLLNSPSDTSVHSPRHFLSRQRVPHVLHPRRCSLHPIPQTGSKRISSLSMDSNIRRLCRDPFLRGPSVLSLHIPISVVNYSPLAQMWPIVPFPTSPHSAPYSSSSY